MSRIKISTRLTAGFALLTIIIAISVFSSIWQINALKQQASKVVELRIPTAKASLIVLNGVNHALAALRGWMLLGKEKFKAEREQAWHSEINVGIKTLETMSEKWTNPENIKRLTQMKQLLIQFSIEQKKIEDIAQTKKNIPALDMLNQQATPLASVMSKHITQMIDLELLQEATPQRKELLGMMADVRGTLGLSLANIRGYLLSGDSQYKSKFEQLWLKNEKRFSDLKTYQHLLSNEQLNAFTTFESARTKFSAYPSQMLTLRSQQDWNLANHWLSTEAAPLGFQIKEILDEMTKNQAELLADDATIMTQTAESSVATSWVVFIVSILVALLTSILVSRSIVTPINKLKQFIISTQESKNLTLRADVIGHDEISEMNIAVNGMLEEFQRSLLKVSEASNKIAETSEETSAISVQIEQTLQQQSAETEIIATAMNEMSATVNDVAKNTTNTAVASNNAADAVSAGTQGMQQTIALIHQLAETIKNASGTINELERRTTSIASVLEVINGIAEQTNLLALNAAIEAARAGEQGRGFAVVADEVRALASRTQESTGEIRQMMELLQQGSKDATSSMNESQFQVSKAVEQATSTGKALTSISEAIISINDMSAQIATASEQQSAVAEEITSNVVNISDKAQETAQATAQTSKTSRELAHLATEMKTLVQYFKV